MMVAPAANGGGSSTSTTSGAGHGRDQVITPCSTAANSSVPPGFRFHPTDEELLHYYLRKKVSYEPIDLDVIREVDLNKLEPWDLKDKCRIGSSGPAQNEWYFFSHKDKKYPTGTRTNRATAAGFWKATGRDKPIHMHMHHQRIGMRKTLVFYIGRAPHGRKTDWIMHEYRLDDQQYYCALNNIHHHHHQLEDGWVVCRVFKKKNNSTTTTTNSTSSTSSRGFQQPDDDHEDQVILNNIINDHDHQEENFSGMMMMMKQQQVEPKPNSQQAQLYDYHDHKGGSTSMPHMQHLPQLLSPESMSSAALRLQHHHQLPHPPSSSSSFLSGGGGGNLVEDINYYYCNSQNLLSLTSGRSSSSSSAAGNSGSGMCFGRVLQQQHNEKLSNGGGGDWSFLDKLLNASSHQNLVDQQTKSHSSILSQQLQAAAHAHPPFGSFN